jgi:hypothetical protein
MKKFSFSHAKKGNFRSPTPSNWYEQSSFEQTTQSTAVGRMRICQGKRKRKASARPMKYGFSPRANWSW